MQRTHFTAGYTLYNFVCDKFLLQDVRVVLPLVFVSFGTVVICSYWYIFHVALKSAPRYINTMRPGRKLQTEIQM